MKQVICLVTVVLLASSCASTHRDAGPSPTNGVAIELAANEARVTDNLVLLADASGTMTGHHGHFERAKAAVNAVVSTLPGADARSISGGGYSAGLIGFGGDERSGTPLAPFDREALAQAAGALQPLGWLPRHGGSTPIDEALLEASGQLSGASGQAAVVLVSDGRADAPRATRAAAKRLVSNYSGGDLCLHTVHTGAGSAGAELLREIASYSSCGSATTASALADGAGLAAFTRAVMLGAAPAQPAPRAVPEVDPCERTLRLRGVEFEFDKARLRPESTTVLDIAAEQLKACPNVKVQVIGHTDSVGTDAYNQGLSMRRAQAVADYLVNQGISRSNLGVDGRGESQPVASNDTADGRALNRRVELTPVQ